MDAQEMDAQEFQKSQSALSSAVERLERENELLRQQLRGDHPFSLEAVLLALGRLVGSQDAEEISFLNCVITEQHQLIEKMEADRRFQLACHVAQGLLAAERPDLDAWHTPEVLARAVVSRVDALLTALEQ